jgi:hypothetical protein
MFRPDQAAEPTHEAVDTVVARGARGAVTLAAIATAIVLLMWLAFYLLVFMPRATVP